MKAIYPNGHTITCIDKTDTRPTVDDLRATFRGRWYSLLYAKTEKDGTDMFFVREELHGLKQLPPYNKKASKIAKQDIYGMVLYVREVDIK